MAEYSQWQQALEQHYLRAKQGTVSFYADAQELQTIAGLLNVTGNGAEDLAAAVFARFNTELGRKTYARIDLELRTWHRGPRSAAPPVLPLLVLSVYAASRMRSSGETRSNNFYKPFAEAVLPAGTSVEVEKLRQRLRSESNRLGEFWEQLKSWLESPLGGQRATTLRSNKYLVNIGYSLSQTLVRPRDKGTLQRLLSTKIGPSGQLEGVSAAQIEEIVERNRHEFSQNILTAFDADLRSLLLEVIADLTFEADSEGSDQSTSWLRPRLMMDLAAWETSWVLEGPSRHSGAAAASQALESRTDVRTRGDFVWFVPVDRLRTKPDQVRYGFRYNEEILAGRSLAAELLFFAPETALGRNAFRQVTTVDTGIKYVMAVSADRRLEAEALLEAARPGWSAMRHDRDGVELLEDFVFFKSVEFLDWEALEKQLFDADIALPYRPSPERQQYVRLGGGLWVRDSLGGRRYLAGASPDLIFPEPLHGRKVDVEVDGSRASILAKADGWPLRGFADSPGSHIVKVGARELRFEVGLSGVEQEVQDALKPDVWTNGELVSASSPRSPGESTEASVVGACTHGRKARPTATFKRRRFDGCFLLEGGGVEWIDPPRSGPLFAEEVGLSVSYTFEVAVPSSARWIAQKVAENDWLVSSVADPTHRSAPLRGISLLRTWKEEAQTPTGLKLWDLMVRREGGA